MYPGSPTPKDFASYNMGMITLLTKVGEFILLFHGFDSCGESTRLEQAVTWQGIYS